MEITLHKESVVVDEIKEVKLRSRRAQFIYDRKLGYSQAVMHLADFRGRIRRLFIYTK